MKNIIQLSIKETIPQLEILNKQSSGNIKTRLKMLIILKNNPGISNLELAEKIEVTPNSVRKWQGLYNDRGIQAMLKDGSENRKSLFTKAINDAVSKKLENKEFTRFIEIANWIKANHLPGVNQNTLKNYVRRQFAKELKQIKLLNYEVKESFGELETLYNVSPSFIKPRVKMLIVLKREGSITPSDLARKTEIVYNSAVKWQNLYKIGGLTSLLDVKKGKNNWNASSGHIFTDEVMQAIEQKHATEPFKSYTALYKWVKEKHIKNIKYTLFLKYLHSNLDGKIIIDRSINISIQESVSALELIHDQCAPRIMPRIKMLIILKKEQKITRRELAQKASVTMGSIIKWLKTYRKNGLNKLLENKVGSIVTSKVHNVIKMKLSTKSFDSFSALHSWINETYLPGVKYYTLHRYVGRHFSTELKMMKAPLTIPITESLSELEAKLQSVPTSLKSRLQMLIAIKENPAINKTNLSGLIHVVPGTLDRWCRCYAEGGVEKLIIVRKKGRKKAVLPIEIQNAVLKYISRNPSPNITELHQIIISDYSKDMTYNRLYRYVRRQMGTATLVKPTHNKKHVREIGFARAVA